VDIPSQEEVDAFLPEYNPKHAYLDPERPVTQGPFAFPKPYAALRIALNEAVNNSKDVVKEIHDKYAEKFGRRYGNGLIEEYKNDRPISIVAMGSVCGTIKGVVDQRDDVGLLREGLEKAKAEEERKGREDEVLSIFNEFKKEIEKATDEEKDTLWNNTKNDLIHVIQTDLNKAKEEAKKIEAKGKDVSKLNLAITKVDIGLVSLETAFAIQNLEKAEEIVKKISDAREQIKKELERLQSL